MYNDNELMSNAKAGDKTAFDELVKSHRKAAILFAYNFVSDYDTAEDIVQDAFVKIFVLKDNYKPSYSFKTYLYTIIRNSSIDYLRANKVRTRYLSEIKVQETNKELSAEEEFLYEDRYSEIAEMFNNLKGDYKTALYLYSINGCSYNEVAAIMKKTVAQTKITIYRARKKLKSALEERK